MILSTAEQRGNHRYEAHHQAEHMHGNPVRKCQRMGLLVPEAALRETAEPQVCGTRTNPTPGRNKTLEENYYQQFRLHLLTLLIRSCEAKFCCCFPC